MSDVAPTLVACPRCGAQQSATLFTSLDADLLDAQRLAILDGSFERRPCERCGAPFRPEHRLLCTQPSTRTWIVMYPVAERHDFRALERLLDQVLDGELAAAPPAAALALRGLRRRLVFGQHLLTEAARVLHAGIDPALLECAKLLAIRRNLGQLLALGPFELCFERFIDGGGPVLGVHAPADGARRGDLTLEAGAIAEARAAQPELEAAYPELFTRPYVSACRYLYAKLDG